MVHMFSVFTTTAILLLNRSFFNEERLVITIRPILAECDTLFIIIFSSGFVPRRGFRIDYPSDCKN